MNANRAAIAGGVTLIALSAVTASFYKAGGERTLARTRAPEPPRRNPNLWPVVAIRDFLRIESGAQANDPKAQLLFGWMYEHGIGVKQDYAQAFKWFFKAAEQ